MIFNRLVKFSQKNMTSMALLKTSDALQRFSSAKQAFHLFLWVFLVGCMAK
jgi:hypothetical protein